MIPLSYPLDPCQTPHLTLPQDPNWISKLSSCLLHLHVVFITSLTWKEKPHSKGDINVNSCPTWLGFKCLC